MKQHPLIKVKWADHWQDGGDFTLKQLKTKAQPYYGEYAGFLALETKHILIMCSNIWEDGTYSDPMVIMKKCIVERSDK